MTKAEYCKAHQLLCTELSSGTISWEDFRAAVKALDNHEHDYKRDATGDKSCWCWAEQ